MGLPDVVDVFHHIFCLVIIEYATDGACADEWVKNDAKYSQNDELGMFEMGSTIVLLIPEEAVEKPMIAQGEKIGVGEPLFMLNKS